MYNAPTAVNVSGGNVSSKTVRSDTEHLTQRQDSLPSRMDSVSRQGNQKWKKICLQMFAFMLSVYCALI